MTERATMAQPHGPRRPRLPRVPAHVVVMLSAATGGYGLTLAGVAGMQAAAENALIAERAPTVGGLEEVGAAHDRLAVDLDDAVRNYQRAADRYAAATRILDQVDRQLAKVASAVSEIDGTVRKLPTSIRVPVSRTVTTVKAPATHATTGASGG